MEAGYQDQRRQMLCVARPVYLLAVSLVRQRVEGEQNVGFMR
jgi:hypothetical protein